MKLFGGNKLAGGSASRAEVYGLFIAAIVLVGGGVGGAFAYSASGGFNGNAQSTAAPTSSANPSTGAETAANSQASASDSGEANKATNSDSKNNSKKNQSDSSPGVAPEVAPVPEQPVQPQQPVDTRIQEPYIGPASDMFYKARNHICAWDTQALGGFGWGYDPAEPCNRQFEAYIRDNCGTKDPATGFWSGIVFGQRCDEMASGTLPIAY